MRPWQKMHWLIPAMTGTGLTAALTAVLFGADGVLAQAPIPPTAGAPQTRQQAKPSQRPRRKATQDSLTGHGGPIKAVQSDATARQVMTGSFDYSAMLWDLSASKPRMVLRLDRHDGAVNAVAFLPGNKQALTAGDDTQIRLWDLTTGKLIHSFTGHGGKINALAISTDGKLAASASWDGTARLWHLDNPRPGPVLKGHKGPVNAVAFSADASRVFTAGYDGTIVAWTVATGAYQRPLLKHGWGINVLQSISGGRRLLFGALNGAAGVLDPAAGSLIAELPSHQRPVLSLATVAKPGLIATGGGDGIIRVYRQDDWKPIEEYRNPYGPIWALTFVADGTALYYAGLDDFATLWKISPRQPVEPINSEFPRRFQLDAGLSEGERQFARKCSVCHTLTRDGANRAGPTLYKVFGRKAGTVPGYAYSPALAQSNIVWNADTIGKLFALGPDHFTPGSKMPLQKITDDRLRHELIAYLEHATAAAGPPDAVAPNDPGDTPKSKGSRR